MHPIHEQQHGSAALDTLFGTGLPDEDKIRAAKLIAYKQTRIALEKKIQKEHAKVTRCQRLGLKHKNRLPQMSEALMRLIASGQQIGLTAEDMIGVAGVITPDKPAAPVVPATDANSVKIQNASISGMTSPRGLTPSIAHIDCSPFLPVTPE